MLVDALAGKLVIAGHGLALDGFPGEACNREGGALPDSLDVARSSSDLLGHRRLHVGHNLFDQLTVSIDVLPVAHAASNFLGKQNFIATSQHLRNRLGQCPLIPPQVDNVNVFAGQSADFDHLFEGGIADQSTIPVMLSTYGSPGEARW